MAFTYDMAIDITGDISSAYSRVGTSVAKLSSGLRITGAADGAAELAVRELLRADIAVARQASRNIQDGISMVQTAEGAASVISGNLVRMTELAAQAQGGVYSDQQINIMQNEFDQLNAQNTQIQETVDFNGVKLYEDSQNINIGLVDGAAFSWASAAVTPISVDLTDGSMKVHSALERAIDDMNEIRGGFGGIINLLDDLDAVVKVQIENIFAAESRISDVDMASQTAALTQEQIIAQSAIAAQAHSNSISQVMSMLL